MFCLEILSVTDFFEKQMTYKYNSLKGSISIDQGIRSKDNYKYSF